MSWEPIIRCRSAASCHSPEWVVEPRISITKKAVVLNKILLDALGVKEHDFILVLVDKMACKLGLKIAETDQDRLGAYSLRRNGKNAQSKDAGSSLMLSVPRVAKTFPLAVDRDYPVRMPTGGMVIEVQLPNPRANKGEQS